MPISELTIANTKLETLKHISDVRKLLKFIALELLERGEVHDQSKLEEPELSVFAEHMDELKGITYGSKEYEECLKSLDVAVQHHYAKNRHHPNHFPQGINDMNLLDIIELFCDWKAATLKHHDGNLLKSIEINAKRFNIDSQLTKIFQNTAALLDTLD